MTLFNGMQCFEKERYVLIKIIIKNLTALTFERHYSSLFSMAMQLTMSQNTQTHKQTQCQHRSVVVHYINVEPPVYDPGFLDRGGDHLEVILVTANYMHHIITMLIDKKL